jgi:hypothetical protein
MSTATLVLVSLADLRATRAIIGVVEFKLLIDRAGVMTKAIDFVLYIVTRTHHRVAITYLGVALYI